MSEKTKTITAADSAVLAERRLWVEELSQLVDVLRAARFANERFQDAAVTDFDRIATGVSAVAYSRCENMILGAISKIAPNEYADREMFLNTESTN